MQNSLIIIPHSLACVIDRKIFRHFLPLPFAQKMSFFSVFLHGFNSRSKNYSVVGGAIHDVTTRTYVGISVDGTVKSLCGLGLF